MADFRRAVDANALVAGESAANVHDGVSNFKCSGSIADAVFAGRDDGSDSGQHDLAAVGVACKDQVEAKWIGPIDLVW